MKNTNNYRPGLFLWLLFTVAPFISFAQVKLRSLEIQLPFTKEKQKLTVEVRDGLVYLEDDIILGRAEALFNPHEKAIAIRGGDYRWENGVIPYFIESDHPLRNQILNAIEHVNDNTNLELRPLQTNDDDYIVFVNGNACSSYIGRQKGRQNITVGPCSFGTIVHEICHAAGLYHEQSRSDRDDFISINLGNIQDGKASNFEKRSSGVDLGDYDYNSIMHYGSTAFGCQLCSDGKKYCDLDDCPTNNCSGCTSLTTIAVKTPPAAAGTVIGQRNGLSNGDIAALNALYPCPGPYRRNICGLIQGLHASEQSVFAKHTIDAADDGCTVLVVPASGNAISWRSGRQIVFHPGAQINSVAMENVSFRAYIKDCPNPFLDENAQEETPESISPQISDSNLGEEVNKNIAGITFSLKIYPNPFKSQTTIAFELPKAMSTSIYIYNTVGKAVHRIQSDFPVGYNEVSFENTQNLPPGVYFVRLQAGDFSQTQQAVISR